MNAQNYLLQMFADVELQTGQIVHKAILPRTLYFRLCNDLKMPRIPTSFEFAGVTCYGTPGNSSLSLEMRKDPKPDPEDDGDESDCFGGDAA